MPRFVLDIAYKGTAYSGWERQKNTDNTIQEIVERTLTLVLRTPTTAYGAGRTDAGVHAETLPAHFDYPGELHSSFLIAMNSVLPADISVKRVLRAKRDNFHARYDATNRGYQYRMIFGKNPFLTDFSFECRKRLDYDKLSGAAPVFFEYDSYETFCKARATNKTFICKITRSEWKQENGMWTYYVNADRFLRGMVRTMVGTMFLVAEGKMTNDDLRRALEAKDRRHAGMAVFAGGLFLTEVHYPEGELEEVVFQPDGKR